MQPHVVSLINAILLIVLAGWGYFSSPTPSVTALIPALLGVILLACNPGVKNKNKVVAHIAVVVTLLAVIGLIKPLMGVISRDNTAGIIRVSIMLISSVIALIAFIKNFIDVRKNREAGIVE